MLLIQGPFSKASRHGKSSLTGPDPEPGPPAVWKAERSVLQQVAHSTLSTATNVVTRFTGGRVFQDRVYFSLACLRSFRIVGSLHPGDL